MGHSIHLILKSNHYEWIDLYPLTTVLKIVYLPTEDLSHIINGCIQNDRRSQEVLYKSFYKSMITLCLRYTKNESEAVEVLNNGFLRVFKNLQQYKQEKASLYTWIRTIVINSCLDHIKAKQKETQSSEVDASTKVHIAPEVISKIKVSELLGLVRQLAPATQAVFNLYAIEGYSHKEISELLKISEGTSKWHLSEAKRVLRHKIQNEN